MFPLEPYGKTIYSTELGPPHLQHSIVLEQFEAICLQYDPVTQIYYICDSQSKIPVLQTNQWVQAYHFWISLIRQTQLSCDQNLLEPLSISDLHRLIDSYCETPEFGQLLYSRDRQFQGLLKYSVQLSIDHAIRWTTSTPHPNGLGEFIIEKVGRRQHRPAKWIEQQPKTAIVHILLRSIETFHQCWDYNLYQFNSEHWARLTVTGECSCLQSEEIYRYWEHAQASSQDSMLGAEPIILETNSEVATLLNLAIAP